MSSEITIEHVATDLAQLGCEISASEVHGTLCGILCGKNNTTLHDWLSLTLLKESQKNSQSIRSRGLLLEAISGSFEDFFLMTISALADNNLKFYPLLPEDEDKMVRLIAIAEWAQGFLMGLTLAGVKSFKQYPDEVTEFIEAMASISTASDYELAGDESDEEAIFEFTEFIRMGVLFINEEINPMRVPVDIPESISTSLANSKYKH